jgi:predicted transcriptional regulator
MNSTKKARLGADGWKVGTAAEFLGLSAEEAAYVEIKIALARVLKAQRVRRKQSQTELAKLIGSSQSRVAKMESGDPSVSADLLLRSALALGTPRTLLARAMRVSTRRLARARRA